MPRLTSLSSKIFSITTNKSLNPFKLIKTIFKPSGASIFSRNISYDGRYVLSTDLGNNGKAYLFDTELNTSSIVTNPDSYVSAYDDFGDGAALVKDGYIWIGSQGEEVLQNGTLFNGQGVVYRWSINDLNNYTIFNLPSIVTQRSFSTFGAAIASNSQFTLISSGERNTFGQNNMGAVYVYDNNMNFIRRIPHPNNRAGAAFGLQIKLNNNNIALISSPYDIDGGKAYLYNIETGTLLNVFNNPNLYNDATLDNFARDIALSSTHCAINAFSETDGTNTGIVYVYRLSDYGLVSTILNPNIRGGGVDDFSRSIAITDTYIYIGSPYETNVNNSQAGVIYIYSLNGVLVKTVNNPINTVLMALENMFIEGDKLITNDSTGNILIFKIDESLL